MTSKETAKMTAPRQLAEALTIARILGTAADYRLVARAARRAGRTWLAESAERVARELEAGE